MCRRRTELRALVYDRLTAAAEEIFALFESTLVEFEEELCRSREKENQRRQEGLELRRGAGVQMRIEPSLSQEVSQTQQIKQELEEEQLSLPVPKFSAVCERPSRTEEKFPQHQNEQPGETFAVDVNAQPHSSAYNEEEEDWNTNYNCPEPQMETDNGGNFNQPQTEQVAQNPGLSPRFDFAAAETSANANNGHTRVTVEGKKHQCPFCTKRFGRKDHLQTHIRIHTGERPFSCSTCNKRFSQSSHLDVHKRTHTGERPYSCTTCNKGFVSKGVLDLHMRTHTGERPYACSVCGKSFVKKSNLRTHMRLHTGERPYSCAGCDKTFVKKSSLDAHILLYSCDLAHFEAFQQQNQSGQQ